MFHCFSLHWKSLGDSHSILHFFFRNPEEDLYDDEDNTVAARLQLRLSVCDSITNIGPIGAMDVVSE